MSEYKDKKFGESKKARGYILGLVVLLLNRGISVATGGAIDAPDEFVMPIAELAVDAVIGISVTAYTIAQGRVDEKLAERSGK